MLTPFVDGLWTVGRPGTMMGLHLGRRMTIVRLSGGTLLLHSPVEIDEALKREIESLGDVAHIVAPNAYHHLHAGQAKATFPYAMLHGPAALQAKRRDLSFDAELTERPHADWEGELQPVTIAGSLLAETVFVHPESRTVISADLFENFQDMPHLPTRLYLKANGTWRRPGWPHVLKLVYRDKRAARASIDRLLEHDIDRAIISHGEPVERGAKETIRETFRFLG